ncbi:glutaredoxin family protein [Candidatus Woesearchaeota archaeon]|nr:glutaredoxin family protein [Candidatus Woesearchaeota archaeon]
MAIKVYYSPTCPVCKKLLDFLKDNNIEFESVDVSENQDEAKRMINETGDYIVPVIDINGKTIEGFDEEKLKKELKIQ